MKFFLALSALVATASAHGYKAIGLASTGESAVTRSEDVCFLMIILIFLVFFLMIYLLFLGSW